MTQEEKAKRYDEAIERANIIYTDKYKPEIAAFCKQSLENIFPELKESEDEKIRKDLIQWVDEFPDTIWRGHYKKDILAWLEKQDIFSKKDVDDAYLKGVSDTKNEIEKQYEANYQIRKDIATFLFNYNGDIKDRAKWMNYLGIKVSFVEKQGKKPQGKSALEAISEEKVDNQNCVKPADEPKFHEGEWLTENHPNNYARFVQILEIVNVQGKKIYRISRDLHNDEDIVECRFIEDNWHHFNIHDAKDGDVLASDNGVIILVKESRSSSWGYRLSYHCAVLYDGTFEHREFYVTPEVFFPATKEQRDLLFSKMKKAGYEWMAIRKN